MITKEQAIEILDLKTSLIAVEKLKYYAGFNQDKVVELIQEAMNMGVEALKGKDTNVPSKWIPCSERLPEKDQSVLVQPRWADEKFELVIAWRSVNRWSGKDEWEHENDYFDDDEVIAWMPLPEPYKESED